MRELLAEGIRLHQAGDVIQAEALLRAAIDVDPRSADAWSALAAVLCEHDRLDEAAGAAERATALQPKSARFWLLRANIANFSGRPDEAEAGLRRAVWLDPGLAEAHFWLGSVLFHAGRVEPAIASLRHAARLGPGIAEVHDLLGRALLAAGRWSDAMVELEQALRADPDADLDRRALVAQLCSCAHGPLPAFLHAELCRFFARSDIDASRWAEAGLRALRTRPAFRVLCDAGDDGSPVAPAEFAVVLEVAREPLFGLLLRHARIAQPEIEVMLARLRRTLLLDPSAAAAVPLAFLASLALQCIANEHVWSENDAEREAVARLAVDVANDLAGPSAVEAAALRRCALLAAYRPIADCAGIDGLLDAGTLPPALDALLDRAVREVREERRLRADIVQRTPIEGDVSRAVRGQYEAAPYPRWLALDRVPAVPPEAWLARELPAGGGPYGLAAPCRILFVGCGTGADALSIATGIAGAQVTAIDLSRASLAYAARMARRLGIANIEFAQADLFELETPAAGYDVVFCVGVLNHVRDPAAGLRSVARQLRPDGLLRLGLYSERARDDVNAARREILERGIAADDDAIRAYRAEVLRLPAGAPERSLLRWRDFHCLSECRDLLFHVEEHQFGLPALAALLRENRLEVLGLSRTALPAWVESAYRKLFPDDATMTDLLRWDAFEARHPEAFVGMYPVWCRLAAR